MLPLILNILHFCIVVALTGSGVQYHGVGIKVLLVFLKALKENQYVVH